KALFFCVGENIYKYPEVAKEIINQGHSIGNHTYNHRRITKLGKPEISEQIDLVTEILKEKLDYKNLYFRPPHGRFNISLSGILQEKNLKNIMWSLLTYDYKNRLDIVKFGVRKYLRNDSIIVLHDSLKSKDIIIDSIRYITDEVLKKGFVFGEAEECLK
ncbi:MAG: polysaccharide deacetylase family protein, partial [Ignavibacteriales bacterium]